MIQNKIVIRYADGRSHKGTTNNFSADKAFFHFIPLDASSDSKPLEVRLADLKAVFFVRKFDTEPRSPDQEDIKAEQNIYGRQVTVVFKDGEVLKGTTTTYNINRLGFSMIPTDLTSNNQRCFVVRQATKDIMVT